MIIQRQMGAVLPASQFVRKIYEDGRSSGGKANERPTKNYGGLQMDAIKLMTQDCIKEQPPVVEIGDTVRVSVKIREGDKERIQVFEGTVIARRGSGVSETFTVRRVSYGVGVERVFPVNAPAVDRIEVVRHGKIRRSKLYYLRDRVGKAAKVKELIKK